MVDLTNNAVIVQIMNQVLQIMLYLPKYGKLSLETIIQSHILNFKIFGGLETNHIYMNIIISQKCI